jgi:hypothetical protein
MKDKDLRLSYRRWKMDTHIFSFIMVSAVGMFPFPQKEATKIRKRRRNDVSIVNEIMNMNENLVSDILASRRELMIQSRNPLKVYRILMSGYIL